MSFTVTYLESGSGGPCPNGGMRILTETGTTINICASLPAAGMTDPPQSSVCVYNLAAPAGVIVNAQGPGMIAARVIVPHGDKINVPIPDGTTQVVLSTYAAMISGGGTVRASSKTYEIADLPRSLTVTNATVDVLEESADDICSPEILSET
jgi:hypothetical protein